jgi:hypothetical protein
MKYKCDFCGKECKTTPSHFKRSKHHFCSRECLAKYSSKTNNPEHYAELKFYDGISKNMVNLNKRLNPLKMTFSMRLKISKSHREGASRKSTTYPKFLGRHLHRRVAEMKLGRPLKPGEVVHHIDFDRQNSDASNLHVFKSQKEHAKYHAEHKEVVPK